MHISVRFGRAASLLALFVMVLGSSSAKAQARATAYRTSDLQAGGGFTFGDADYGQPTIRGYSLYAAYDFKPHFGIEVDFHQVKAPSPSKIYERSYEVGGRYVRHYGIFHPYGRVMYGRGVFNYQYDVANLAYNMLDFAGGVDINVARHINVRADYEFQHWFGFRGTVGPYPENTTSSLSPKLFTIGAAYHFR